MQETLLLPKETMRFPLPFYMPFFSEDCPIKIPVYGSIKSHNIIAKNEKCGDLI
jgi:hypothetical protein